MNPTFDKTRFLQLLKWETITEKKDYIRFASFAALIMTLLCCSSILGLYYKDFNVSPENTQTLLFNTHLEDMSEAFICMCAMCMTLCASLLMRNMKTKQQRVTYLMLPASNLEKYLVRLIHVSAGYFICLCAALIFADVMQNLFAVIMLKGAHGSLTLWMLTDNSTVQAAIGPHFGKFAFSLFTYYTFNYAFWILGATLFRRNAAVCTLAAQFVIGFGLMFVFGILDSFIDFNAMVFPSDADTLLSTLCSLAWIGTAVMYWGSYRLFCRMQVINNKWINV